MSAYQIYHLIGHILSLVLIPEKKEMVEKKLRSIPFPWVKFIAIGNNHLVLPAIYIRLMESGLLHVLPGIIAEHLQKIYHLNLERNTKIISQSEDSVLILKKAGIQALFLKGVGNILDGLYSSPAERIIQDIDILTTSEQWVFAAEALKNEGYVSRDTFSPPDNSTSVKHYPRLFRDGDVAGIELHRLPVKTEYSINLTPDEVWGKKVPARNMPSCFVMSDEHKIIHNFVHSQLEHEGHLYASIFMRNLYDQLLLSRTCPPSDVFSGWQQYQKKTNAYVEVMRRTFYPENIQKKLPFSKTGLYPLRYELNLYSGFLSRANRLSVRFFRSYILKPISAVTDRELRIVLFRKLGTRSWYKKHLNSYNKYFNT